MNDQHQFHHDNDVAWTCHHCGGETITTYQVELPRCYDCAMPTSWPTIHDDENTIGPKVLTGVSPYDIGEDE